MEGTSLWILACSDQDEDKNAKFRLGLPSGVMDGWPWARVLPMVT